MGLSVTIQTLYQKRSALRSSPTASVSDISEAVGTINVPQAALTSTHQTPPKAPEFSASNERLKKPSLFASLCAALPSDFLSSSGQHFERRLGDDFLASGVSAFQHQPPDDGVYPANASQARALSKASTEIPQAPQAIFSEGGFAAPTPLDAMASDAVECSAPGLNPEKSYFASIGGNPFAQWLTHQIDGRIPDLIGFTSASPVTLALARSAANESHLNGLSQAFATLATGHQGSSAGGGGGFLFNSSSQNGRKQHSQKENPFKLAKIAKN
ncbi:MAG: hypothetical protein VKK59_04085 [Vampirovibrionales bacterium]|nr:hypothetical protein [Vampirovibrionales bacterium]